MSIDDEILASPPGIDYGVECARCGRRIMASEGVPEEGDEWECIPCWERCEAQERASLHVPESRDG